MSKHSQKREQEVSVRKTWSPPANSAKSSNTAAGKTRSPHTTKPAKSTNTATYIPVSETSFGFKDTFIRELIKSGEVQERKPVQRKKSAFPTGWLMTQILLQ